VPPCVDEERCIGCGVCIRVCPSSALRLKAEEASSSEVRRLYCEVYRPEACIDCGRCLEECLVKALSLAKPSDQP
jgi:ferredoxin